MTQPAQGASPGAVTPAATTTTDAGGNAGAATGAPTQLAGPVRTTHPDGSTTVEAPPRQHSQLNPTPAATPAPAPAPVAGQAGDQPAGPPELASLHPDTQKYIKDLRDQAANVRTSPKELAKAQEAATAAAAEAKQHKGVLDAILKALDPTGANTAPTPEQLAQKVVEGEQATKRLTRENRTLTMRIDTWRTATALGANPLELDDSVQFLDAVKKLDPEHVDYKADLAQLIATTVESNPARFKLAGTTATASAAAPVAATSAPSGASFAGGSGSTSSNEELSIDGFRKSYADGLKAR